jgi:hypothetical protein
MELPTTCKIVYLDTLISCVTRAKEAKVFFCVVFVNNFGMNGVMTKSEFKYKKEVFEIIKNICNAYSRITRIGIGLNSVDEIMLDRWDTECYYLTYSYKYRKDNEIHKLKSIDKEVYTISTDFINHCEYIDNINIDETEHNIVLMMKCTSLDNDRMLIIDHGYAYQIN